MIPVCYDLSQLDGMLLIRCLLAQSRVQGSYGQIDDETDTDDQQISKGNPPAQTGKSAYLSVK